MPIVLKREGQTSDLNLTSLLLRSLVIQLFSKTSQVGFHKIAQRSISPVRPVFITLPDSNLVKTSTLPVSMSYSIPQTSIPPFDSKSRTSRKSVLQTRLNFSTEIRPREESRTPKPESIDEQNFSQRFSTEGNLNIPRNTEYSTALDEARSRAAQNQQISPEEFLLRDQPRSFKEATSTIRNPLAVRPSFARNPPMAMTDETPIRGSNNSLRIGFITNQNEVEGKISRNRITIAPNKDAEMSFSQAFMYPQPSNMIQNQSNYNPFNSQAPSQPFISRFS